MERLEAGVTLPFELSLSWAFWGVFAVLVARPDERSERVFLSIAVGAVCALLLGSVFSPSATVGLAGVLVLALWLTLGRSAPSAVTMVSVGLLSFAVLARVYAVHPDLAADELIAILAVVSFVGGASFFGGVVKQCVDWFPKQAPIGSRILASWMVALVAILLAMESAG